MAIAYTAAVGSPPPERPARRTWFALTVAIAAVLQLVVVNYWPAFESPNEWGRAYQALAVVGRGSLDIGPEIARLGRMEDVASAGGRLFPNKAPGMIPLLVPAAALARALAGANPARELRLTLVLGRLLAAALPFLLSIFLLERVTVERLPHGGPVAVVAYALATPALAASLLLFSHALTACLLLAAFLLLFDSPRPRWPNAMLAGALLVWAAACEYPVALPGVVLALAALPRLRVRGALAGLAGGAVPAVLLGAYNAACFGSPLSISTAHESYAAFATLVRHGFFGVSWPTVAGLAGLLFSPARGLLVWVPLVAVAALGAIRLGAGGDERGSRIALVGSSVALVLAMSGYARWHGGWFAGPRYLLPVLPLLFVLVARGVENLGSSSWGRAFVVLAALWGWLQVWPVIASFPFPPEDYPLPFATLARPLLAAGVWVPSWLPRPVELAVLTLLAAAAAVMLFLISASGGGRRERLAAATAFLVAGVLAVNVRAPRTWQASLERAVIHDVYTGAGSGALEALRPRADTPARRTTLAAWIARRDAGRHSR
jgi:hypothetical protein